MVNRIAWIVVAGMVLAGCQGPSSNPRGTKAVTVNHSMEPTSSTTGGAKPSEPGAVDPPPVGTSPDGATAKGDPPNAGGSTPSNPKPGGPLKITVPEPRDPPPQGSGGWTKSKLTAEAVAAQVGKALMNLKGAYGNANVYIKTEEGNGYHQLEYRIVNPKRYRLDYLSADAVPNRQTVVADGERKRAPSSGGAKVMPVGQPVEAKYASGDIALWAVEFSRAAFAGLVDQKDPWAPMLRAVRAKPDQYTLAVETRQLPYQGKTVTSHRFLINRKGGPEKLEIVVDGARWLPVTIRSDTGTRSYEWLGGWKFNQTFESKHFVVGN